MISIFSFTCLEHFVPQNIKKHQGEGYDGPLCFVKRKQHWLLIAKKNLNPSCTSEFFYFFYGYSESQPMCSLSIVQIEQHTTNLKGRTCTEDKQSSQPQHVLRMIHHSKFYGNSRELLVYTEIQANCGCCLLHLIGNYMLKFKPKQEGGGERYEDNQMTPWRIINIPRIFCI